MSVYKRGDTFHYRFMLNGERYRGSTKQNTPTKARAFESALMARIMEGGGNPRMKRAPLLRDAAKYFLEEIDRRAAAGNADPDTKRHYHNAWRMLSTMSVAGMRVDQITTNLAAGLQFPGGPWNARAGQQCLGRLLNWCAENGYLRAAPKIKRSKAQGRSLRIDPQLEAALLSHMETDVADVFIFMLDCGMRPEEVMRMRWENVHWNQAQYFNPYGKTAASRRMVPLSNRMISRLEARRVEHYGKTDMADRAKVWVFPGKTKAGHRSTVAKKFEEARKAAKLDTGLVLYLARHEFATTFLESGGDIGTLMKVMGHSSISTTMKYLHPGIKGAADVINRRNRAGLAIVRSA